MRGDIKIILTLKIILQINFGRSTTRADVYKPPYGGFVDIDIEKERSISLRTLVSSWPQTQHRFKCLSALKKSSANMCSILATG
jgi:hypothetical protein